MVTVDYLYLQYIGCALWSFQASSLGHVYQCASG